MAGDPSKDPQMTHLAILDATAVAAAKGAAVLAQGAQGFVELLRDLDCFDLSRLREEPIAEPEGL